jgi:Tol biopolymer transport system component
LVEIQSHSHEKEIMKALTLSSLSALISSVATLCGSFASAGCGTKPESSITASGTLSVPLRGTGPDGSVYRLKNGVFSIAGSAFATLDSEDYLDQSSANIPLAAGGYSITLSAGWSLDREMQGAFVPVQANLMSRPLQVFTIVANKRTAIVYTFEADGHLVQIGDGDVGVAFDARPKDTVALCDPAAPFVETRSVAGLRSVGSVEGARFSSDERVVYFAFNQSGNRDLYVAERSDRGAAFGQPRPLAMINTRFTEAWPSISPDGLTLFFESNRGGPSRIYASARATTLDDFCAPALVEDNRSVLSDGQPFVVGNREAIFFSSNRTLQWELFRANGNGTVKFERDTVIGVNSPSDEVAPVPTADDLALYFSSTRADGGARGGQDIWVARRASPTEPYGAPLNVIELNTGADDLANWASPDGCRLYFDRTDSHGSEIFVAEKAP